MSPVALFLPLLSPMVAPVDLDIKGMRADYAVAALGKAAGVELRAKPALQDSTVVLRLHGVTLEEAKARLAKALGATWTKDGAADVLDRPGLSPEKRVEVRGHYATASIKAYLDGYKLLPSLTEKNLKDIDDALAKPRPTGPYNDAIKQYDELSETLQHNNPESRMLVALSKAIGPERIGQVPPGGRAVYSLRPTLKQWSIPSGMANVATDWIREEKVFHDYIKGRTKQPGDYRFQGYEYRYQDDKVPTAEQMADLWFVIESRRDGVTMWVDAFKTDGNSPFMMRSSIGVMFDRTEAGKDESKPPEVDVKYKPSPRALFGHKVAESWVDPKMDRNVLLRDLPAFSDEEQGDALLAFEAEAVFAWAEAKSENLVAVMPEHVAGGYSASPEGIDASSVAYEVYRNRRAKVEEKDGWITLTPTDPLAERAIRPARRELFYLVDRGLRTNKLSLDDLADVAARLDDAQFQEAFNNASRILGRPSQNSGDIFDIRALRLYGMLDAQERKRVLAGERVEVNPFGRGNIAREMDRIVYRTIFRVMPPDYGGVEFGKENDLGWISGQTWAGGRASEATYSLGNGIPQSTRLVFQTSPILTVQTKSSENRDWDWQQTHLLESFLRDRVSMRSNSAQYEKDNLAAVVPMNRLGIKFDFGDKSWGMVNLLWPDDYRLPSFASPSSVIAAYPEKYAEELKKQGGG